MAKAAEKAKAFGKGAATGGAMTGAVVLTLKGAAAVAKKAAPRAVAAVVGTVSMPVVVGATLAGGVYGGVKAAKQGKSGKEIALGTLSGASSLGTNIVGDAVVGVASAAGFKMPKGPDQGTMTAAVHNVLTPQQEAAAQVHNDTEEVRAQLGRQIKDAEAKMKAQEPTGKGPAWKKANEERERAIAALGALDKGRNEKLAEIGGGKPAAPSAPADDRGLLTKAKEAVFGKPGPKPVDALETQRRALEGEIAATRKEMEDEAKTKRGPRYDKLSAKMDEKQGALKEIAEKQAAKEKAETEQYYQLGALAAGALIGLGTGHAAVKVAKRAAATAEAGVAKLAAQASKAIKSNPKGVIAGTPTGDKVAAAAAAVKTAAKEPTISKAAAYGLPAINIAQGATAYTIGHSLGKDDPTGKYYQLEGIGAMAAGAFGMKGAIAARAVRATISPDVSAKIKAASNRLRREKATGAPAAAAQVSAAAAVQSAKTAAAVSAVRGVARVGTEAARGTARVVKAAGETAVARVRAQKAVTRAEGPKAQYKDQWIDSRGRKYTRRDKAIRTRANDNGSLKAAG